jgi:hypothetical protein
MEITCDNCGYPFSSADSDDSRTEWRCPICGSPAHRTDQAMGHQGRENGGCGNMKHANLTDEIEIAAENPAVDESPQASPPDLSNPADTVFQPALMMDSIMDELEPHPEDGEFQQTAPTSTGTELIAEETQLPSPFLDLETLPYLLILGARPGEERRPIVRAKTSFGRSEADVNLADPSVSSAHFQIEAFGSEFFVRDLASRNGTYLNNNRIRYSQLLPGDQITAGRTTLIFRLSDDQIGRD